MAEAGRARGIATTLPQSGLSHHCFFQRDTVLQLAVPLIAILAMMNFSMTVWTSSTHIPRIVWPLVRQSADVMGFQIVHTGNCLEWGRSVAFHMLRLLARGGTAEHPCFAKSSPSSLPFRQAGVPDRLPPSRAFAGRITRALKRSRQYPNPHLCQRRLLLGPIQRQSPFALHRQRPSLRHKRSPRN